MGITIEQARKERADFELLATIRSARKKRNAKARKKFFSFLNQILRRG